MNDPGLDGPIEQTGEQVEGEVTGHDEEREEEEDEAAYMIPARWWYASTAFPLVAVCYSYTCSSRIWCPAGSMSG